MAGVILLYHRVATDPCDPYSLCIGPLEFKKQMQFVRQRCSPMGLTDLVHGSDSEDRAVAITFDDGYLDNLTGASPILRELSIPATFFVTTADLDHPKPYWWDVLARSNGPSDHLLHDELVHADLDRRRELLKGLSPDFDGLMPRPMSGDEIRELASQPGHEVGVHTTNHLFLPSQTNDVWEQEIGECKYTLERLLKRRLTAIAYPFGGENPEIARASRQSGFETGVTARRGSVSAKSDPLRLPRLEVSADVNIEAALDELFGNVG